jgi:O-antigen ligase
MLDRINIDKTYQFLLIFLAFLLPITVFGANVIIGIIVILCFVTGTFKDNLSQILANRLLVSSIIFYLLHLIGLLWSEDLVWGLHISRKMWYFILLFPLLFIITKREYVNYYIFAFLSAIFLTEVLSFLNWFNLIPDFKNSTGTNPTPFMSHISYNPILAFSIYLLSHKILFNTEISFYRKFFYILFLIAMVINMFITGGRAGQVMFFAVMCILIFQYYESERIKAFFVMVFLTSSVFITAYQASPLFNERVNITIDSIQEYSNNKNTSVGLRVTFTVNSFDIIKENPILGVGTGDFPTEYKKNNIKNTPHLPNATNPHNMYILILVQLGLIGIISFLSIFYYQIRWSFKSKNKFIKDVGFALPVLFLIIMLSDSYLLGHYTTLMFIFFSSFLYKDFEKP